MILALALFAIYLYCVCIAVHGARDEPLKIALVVGIFWPVWWLFKTIGR